MDIDRLKQLADELIDVRGESSALEARPCADVLLLRALAPTPLDASLYQPVLCLILRGAKEVVVGADAIHLGVGDALVVSHDTPLASRITSASRIEPYLALIVNLDLSLLRSLHSEVSEMTGSTPSPDGHALSAAPAEPALVDVLCRYLELDPGSPEGRVLGPLVRRELYLRLLLTPHSAMLRGLLEHDSNSSLVARAIDQIRRDYKGSIAVADLASEIGMSPSSLHHHFKRVTSTTPVQYQKDLRLLEARRLLATGQHSVTSAAGEVGYESASQFSREYSRKYGAPPSRHVTAM